MGKRHLAFDLGAESGRAVVGTVENGRLVMDEIHRFPTQSMYIYDSLRWNVYRLYEEVIKGLRAYSAKYGSELDSIGVDTWGCDYCFLKENGRLYDIPFQYRDKRTKGTDKLLDEKLGRKKIYDTTGIQFMNLNTLNQIAADSVMHPEVFDEASDMLFIGDFLHYMLTGRKVSEFTVASTSQMLNAFEKQWSGEICGAFGFKEKLRPDIIFAGSEIGKILPEIAREAGISENVSVIAPAVHDTASAAAAIPACGENWAYISSGTWCMVGLETNAPVINDLSYSLNVANSGGALGKNLFLKNVMGLWVIQQCKKVWNRKYPELDYSDIVELAVKARPFGGYIDPDDDIFFAPSDCVAAIGEYFEKTGQHGVELNDIGSVARIVYESLALKYRHVLELLKQAAGQQVDVFHIIGGGTKNGLLNKFTASAAGIKVIAGPAEATATGNLLLQAYGSGELRSLSEIREVVRNSNRLTEYAPEDSEAWEEAYLKYKTLCGL